MDAIPTALLQQILRELRAILTELYGPRLKTLMLYGSYARGEATDGSDIDVALVLDDFASAGAEIARSSALVAELCLEHACVISAIPIREHEWLAGEDPFLMNVHREAILVS